MEAFCHRNLIYKCGGARVKQYKSKVNENIIELGETQKALWLNTIFIV